MKRIEFIKSTLGILGASAIGFPTMAMAAEKKKKLLLYAHVWIYAAKQPGYDVSNILPQIFSDVKYAGLDGVETMEQPLRKEATTKIIGELIEQYNLPLLGCSYGAEMWDKTKYNEISDDVEIIVRNMKKVKARTFGVSVGHPSGRLKTEEELDAQSEVLLKLIAICEKNGVVLNLHNHTYEVENNLFDLKGTLKRIPDVKLGPDLNWLLRANVDPISFLKEYKENIVFIHLRDQLINGNWSESIGEGDVNFKEIGKTIKSIDFKGDLVIELAHDNEFKPTRPIKESLKMSRLSLINTLT
ncbi:sugar phosphate isomerase/epimerase family protein [Bacteroidota bacterium]